MTLLKDASDLYLPAPSAESLTAIAQAMGAAGFEDYTEGKALVKRLIPADSQPDLDVVEHLGVIGKVGVDFPALPNIPITGFNCKNVPTGYYADLETDCQVFHICDTSRKISFLCPNGTIFSQSHLICDWWFKVDCASAPALYESSVEYYSNEQKKSQRVSHTLSKNPDLQQIGADSHLRSESRRTPVPSTTERLLRHRQKLQTDTLPSSAPNTKATARSFQTLFEVNPTQRIQPATAFEKRRKNIVQLITNNFDGIPLKTTLPVYDSSTLKSNIPAYDHNSLKEMQVAAETASFVQNQNRQLLQEYNAKNFRPYPVYTPNITPKPAKSKNNPSLTTLYDIQAPAEKHITQYLQEATTKRQTLVPYTKSYATTINERNEPYTRPGVSLLRDFLEKEKNKSISATTEKIFEATARSDKYESQTIPGRKVTIETKDSYESATWIPQSTRSDKTETAFSDSEVNSSLNPTTQETTEASYKERRDRLMRKLNFEASETTEPAVPTTPTDKYFGDQPNRAGLFVPPSLTPKTLHSLAIYYATALDNLSTTTPPEEGETTTPAFDEYEPIEQSLPALFSHQTITKYGSLFGHGSNNAELLEEIKLDPNGTFNELAEDLSVQMSQGPLATSPQIRELAQVFTHALSAYLQDPVQFRKVLSDIRPTQPSFVDMLTTSDELSHTEPTTTVNEEDDEILGFSDDHKVRESENSVRGGKALNLEIDYPTTTEETTTTAKPTTEAFSTYSTTTPRNPFRCCGRISASYTTAPTPRDIYSTLYPYTHTAVVNINSLINTNNEVTPTSDSMTLFRHGSGKPNSNIISSFGKTISTSEVTPFNDFSEVTTVPTAWGVDSVDSTLSPITNSHQLFESKKLRATTAIPESTPLYFTETDSIELENEEELQRAHSQSFVSPQNNNLRQGKQLKQDNKKTVRKPSEDLEAPSQSTATDTTTTVQITTQATTTLKEQTEALTTVSPLSSSIFTSPDSDKSTNDFQWQTTFGNWQSTILDPMTLNDGLSPTGPEQSVSEQTQQTTESTSNIATTPSAVSTTNEPIFSSTVNVEVTTPSNDQNERFGKFLRDSTSTEPALDFSTVTDTIVEKAKEIMEGMNATTTQKLMNVMKKTKSKTVKRLILLLVQTCDDDHNSTAEASKKALLEALMAVSQKDMEEIAKEEDLTEAPSTVSDVDYVKTTEIHRRMDRMPVQRRGKKLNIEADAINSLSNPSTTESLMTDETTELATISTVKTTTPSRRGGRKFLAKTTESDQFRTTITYRPIAEARVAPQGDLKVQSDTRALELLRSLYTIAARWG
ncbi:uncharacterized protein LOC126776626 [Nymphalis io]|uniref:uncharacterized protein LOC126776626 n=1 Tax=Inachis io TaxID=171585 RepID=UPI002166DE9B|nr:uncharacterized protein LOC126776626 [Nymphalis io]